MIIETGDCVRDSRTTPATSRVSSMDDRATHSPVRPCPKANSVLTPPGRMTPTLIPLAQLLIKRLREADLCELGRAVDRLAGEPVSPAPAEESPQVPDVFFRRS
jgi:hypothetical protein